MKPNTIYTIGAILLLAGCSIVPTTPQPGIGQTGSTSTGIIETGVITTGTTNTGLTTDEIQPPLTNVSTGNEYTLLFSGTDTETVTMYHTQEQSTNVYFINSDAKSINVKVTFPDGNGNLRLTQIVMPDGNTDGPFGQEIDYDLPQTGGYQLLFHENMMAGDPRSGNVQITVKLIK